MSLGRIFRFQESIARSIRMNFQDIFNMSQLSNPTATNPLAAMTRTGGVARSARILRRLASSPAALGSLTASVARRFCRPGYEC